MESRMSCMEGEIGEMEERLVTIKEARDDMMEARNEQRRKKLEEEEKRERLGALIRQRATNRQEGKRKENKLKNDNSIVECGMSPAKKKRWSSDTDVCIVDEEAAEFTEEI